MEDITNSNHPISIDEEEKFFSSNVESFWRMVWNRFKKHKLAIAGLIVLGIMIVICFLAPVIAPFPYEELHLSDVPDGMPLRPGGKYILGTDQLGRDFFTRCLYGGRISLTVGIVSTMIALAIGIPLGCIAGYYGGAADMIIMRVVEFFACVPTFPLLLTLNAVLDNPSIYLVMAIIGIFGWGGVCRQVRAQFLTLKNQEFVQAAEALGYKDRKVIFKHILPNALTPVIIIATMSVAGGILMESSLSYLGLGVQEPIPSWGAMLKAGKSFLRDRPHLCMIPGILILVVSLALNFIGDGLRDALDPRNTRN